MRRRCVLLCIGLAGAGAQTALGQSAARLLTLDDGRAGQVWQELDHKLRDDNPRVWRFAWQQAHAIGPALVAGLRRRLQRERRVERRLVLLGALAAAGGATAEDQLIRGKWLQAAEEHDRLMALLIVALGPERGGDGGELLRYVVGLDVRSVAMRIAGCLALSRFGTAAALPPSWLPASQRTDPGLVAATLLCSASRSEWVAGWLAQPPLDDSGEGQRPALVWRAAFLAPYGPGIDPRELDRFALAAVRRTEESAEPLRLCAARRLSRSAAPVSPLDELGGLLPADVRVLLASDPGARGQALAKGWLVAVPADTVSQTIRRQLVALYALAATPEQVQSAASAWARSPDIADVACLTLAWRALVRSGELVPGAWVKALSRIPESRWLEFALGTGTSDQPLPASGDQRLDRAYGLAAAGRLPHAAAARELERALWRRGGHPGLSVQACRMELIRDLVLSGSNYARATLAGTAFPYFPADLKPSDDRFFRVACEYFQWCETGLDDVPDSLRLH